MTLRERLPTWLGGKPPVTEERASTKAIDFSPFYSSWYGPGIGSQPSHERLLQENLGVPDAATRAIANRISGLNPLVKVTKREQAGTTTDEILDDHVLKRLIDRPHKNFSRSQVLRLTTQWIVTVGEAYWLKVGNGLGVPGELHPYPPGNVTPRVAQNILRGYTVRDGNGAEATGQSTRSPPTR